MHPVNVAFDSLVMDSQAASIPCCDGQFQACPLMGRCGRFCAVHTQERACWPCSGSLRTGTWLLRSALPMDSPCNTRCYAIWLSTVARLGFTGLPNWFLHFSDYCVLHISLCTCYRKEFFIFHLIWVTLWYFLPFLNCFQFISLLILRIKYICDIY